MIRKQIAAHDQAQYVAGRTRDPNRRRRSGQGDDAMVFCASLVPWASDTMQADPTCPMRKPWLRAPRVRLRLIR
jgi:hypothetical protein